MSAPREEHPEPGLLRMLRAALRAALAPGADDEAHAMARSAAQIVGLPGLDAVLAALEPHRGEAWRGAAQEAVEHLETLAGRNSLLEFRAADTELLARAESLRAAGAAAMGEGAAEDEPLLPPIAPPANTTSVEEALGEAPLAGDRATAIARLARLDAPVAAALRAALEWLAGDPERPRPFRLRAEDSVLEVLCDGVPPEGLLAAHELLREVDGNLSPLAETGGKWASGAWLVRVPAWSPRPVHLMLEQGLLRLAVPWHSVLRLSLVPSVEIEERGGSLTTPVLEPLTPLAHGVGERPVVAIAHGLKRGLLVADRLVWRLGAETCEPAEAPPVPRLRRAVSSDDGQTFWVAEARELLEALPLPFTVGPRPPAPRRAAPPVEPSPRIPEPPLAEPAAPVATLTPEEVTPVAPEPVAVDVPALEETPAVLQAADVEPLVLAAADVEPLAAPAAAVPAPREVVVHAEAPPAPPRIEAPAPREEVVRAEAPAAPRAEAPAPAAPAPPGAVAPPRVADDAAAQLAHALTVASQLVQAEASPPERLPAWLERFGTAGTMGGRAAAPEPPAPAAERARAAVLVAEDSIAARHFLGRMLEQRGLAVTLVESAAALRAELAAGRFRLVCLDVELPDAPGPELLREIRAALEPLDVPLVALVRDDDDTELARAAGLDRWLRKPFDHEEVEHLLARLRLVEARA